ncbi:vesicle transport protein, partial [Paraphysoderma sedebokerense]
FTLSRSQRFKLTISLLAIGVLNFLLAFITLPVILISPGKFATTFTIGSLCLFSCIAVLRGVGTHLKAIFARDRVVVTVAYLGSLIGTVWASFGKKGWLAVWICIIVQMASLLWYFVSYIPGGTSGLLSMSRF